MTTSRIDEAVECFGCGFSCSQAVFSTYAETMGLDTTTALKISGPFGGGMAAMRETCGAVTGAFRVLGLKYGKTKADDDAAKQKSYAVVREFVEKFNARDRSLNRRDLDCGRGSGGDARRRGSHDDSDGRI